MKKILLTGVQGQVGWELQRTLAPLGEVFAFDKNTLDLSRTESISAIVEQVHPDIIVNAAAYTAVDKAESEPEAAEVINSISPGILALEAKRINAILVHYSTDYVFDGTSPSPYLEESKTSPQNVYGKTKLEGEQAIRQSGCKHYIFRTSWVYGSRGKNFLLTMLKLAKEKESLNIVMDQIGAPTWCRMIAEATALILAKTESASTTFGTYNLTASGQTSWNGFAEAIFNYAKGYPIPKINGIPSEAYPTPARRPKNSVLSHAKLEKAFDIWMPAWETSLKLCMEEI